jgi:L-lactate dehydrogenase complex protein LldF
MPALGGYEEYKDIVKICSLCAACNDVCPVKIPLYETIFEHRRVIAEDLGKTPLVENMAFAQYANVIGNSKMFNRISKMAFLGNAAPKVGPLAAWSKERQMPKIAKQWFREWYAERSKEQEG